MASKFSRRHYVAIASALRRGHAIRATLQDPNYEDSRTEADIILENLIWAFKIDNPRFDEAKFRKAVGWE
jgi:hypothetical protein